MTAPVKKSDWHAFLRKTPVWILILIVVMLLIRFVITAVVHWLKG